MTESRDLVTGDFTAHARLMNRTAAVFILVCVVIAALANPIVALQVLFVASPAIALVAWRSYWFRRLGSVILVEAGVQVTTGERVYRWSDIEGAVARPPLFVDLTLRGGATVPLCVGSDAHRCAEVILENRRVALDRPEGGYRE